MKCIIKIKTYTDTGQANTVKAGNLQVPGESLGR